jgi:hypothetical protein
MKLKYYFKGFIGNISLNPTREDRINSAFQHGREHLKMMRRLNPILKVFLNKVRIQMVLQ